MLRDQPHSLVFTRARGTGRGQQITSRWLMLPGQLLPLIKLGGSSPRYRLAFVIKTSQPKLCPVGFTSFVSSSGFLLLLSLEPVVSWLREVAIVSIIDRSYQSTRRSSNLPRIYCTARETWNWFIRLTKKQNLLVSFLVPFEVIIFVLLIPKCLFFKMKCLKVVNCYFMFTCSLQITRSEEHNWAHNDKELSIL